MALGLYDPPAGTFTSVDPVEGGSANDHDYCAGEPVNCYDPGGTMLTPENKQASPAEVLKALAYLSQHPEVVLHLKGLASPAKPAAAPTQQLLPGQNPERGPDPSRPEGNGGRRGSDPCRCPPPSTPRTGGGVGLRGPIEMFTKGCVSGLAFGSPAITGGAPGVGAAATTCVLGGVTNFLV